MTHPSVSGGKGGGGGGGGGGGWSGGCGGCCLPPPAAPKAPARLRLGSSSGSLLVARIFFP
jgi:hypothetical protein